MFFFVGVLVFRTPVKIFKKLNINNVNEVNTMLLLLLRRFSIASTIDNLLSHEQINRILFIRLNGRSL